MNDQKMAQSHDKDLPNAPLPADSLLTTVTKNKKEPLTKETENELKGTLEILNRIPDEKKEFEDIIQMHRQLLMEQIGFMHNWK